MIDSRKKRVLLTGGSGFIGRNLLEHPALSAYEVLAPRHAELDLTDEDTVRRYIQDHAIELIVHSAVKPGHRNAKDLSRLLLTNLRMFYNLARNRDLFERMVVIGSGGIYDNRHYGAKRTEESYDEHVPADEHGFAKYVIEKYIEGVSGIFDLRVFGIYGKYEDYQIRFISNMICKALAGFPLTIKQDRKFDYIFVGDLGLIVARVLERGLPWTSINVTPACCERLTDIARLVLDVVGRPELPLVVSQSGDGIEYSGDSRRLREWYPELELTDLRKGITSLVEWYRTHWASIDPKKLEVDP